MSEINYCFIGIADDQGVLNVGGRLGSALGPQSFLRCYTRMKGEIPVLSGLKECYWPSIYTSIDQTHQECAQGIKRLHERYGLSLVVGGGHDHAYAHLLGISQTLKSSSRIGCINIDAHLDLRPHKPLMTSGSPFYALIENKILNPKQLIEFGIQSHANSKELFEYAALHSIELVYWKELRSNNKAQVFKTKLEQLSQTCDEIVLSIDCDAMAEAYAPGVSAPQSEGFSAEDLIQIAEIAGAHPKVNSLGVFELNPLHDRGDQTSRVAATVAYHFFEGKHFACQKS